jgi:hypothetical protein
MTITTTAAFLVLLLGIIAIVIAVTREGISSVFFWWCAIWVAALAFLGGVFIR